MSRSGGEGLRHRPRAPSPRKGWSSAESPNDHSNDADATRNGFDLLEERAEQLVPEA